MRFVLVALIYLVTAGKKGIFADEPVVPDWIQKLSEGCGEKGGLTPICRKEAELGSGPLSHQDPATYGPAITCETASIHVDSLM